MVPSSAEVIAGTAMPSPLGITRNAGRIARYGVPAPQTKSIAKPANASARPAIMGTRGPRLPTSGPAITFAIPSATAKGMNASPTSSGG